VELGNGRMEIGIRKEETAKWKQDRENRNEEFAPVKCASLLSAQISRGKKVGGLRLRTTWDIVEAAGKGLLPDKVMLNVHPQRWTDRAFPWVKELVLQNFKNVIKRYMIKLRD